MSSRTWICFHCKQSVRRDGQYDGAVPCAECGRECTYLGYKIPVPPRRDSRAWRALREDLRRSERARRDEKHRADARRRHDIEKQIAELEARPENSERSRLIRRLRRELEGA